MNREEFHELFYASLDKAAQIAEVKTGREVPRNYRLMLHGANYPGVLFSPEEAFEILYLGNEQFYLLIDLGVMNVSGGLTTIFTRVSAHDPGPFDSTYNQPKGSGPFKQLIPKEVIFE